MAHESPLTQKPRKPGSNLREPDPAMVRLETSCVNLSQSSPSLPKAKPTKRIPNGTILGEIPLEAAKSFPVHIWEHTGVEPRIAYADLNSHGEQNMLVVKLLPEGGKTAPHPQIVLYVKGPYHVEQLSYFRSNVWDWTTWMEFHLDTRHLDRLIDALIHAKIWMENNKA